MIIEAIWEQQVGHGMEHLVLTLDNGIKADGVAVGELEGKPYRIHYSVQCDARWRTQQFIVRSLLNDQATDLRCQGGEWIDARGQVQAELSGCTELDIMVTPFTNTLPIRRLALEPGKAARISVV